MKSFVNTALITSFLILWGLFLLFGFSFLKFFTDLTLPQIKDITEVFNNTTSPVIAAIAAYYVLTAFKHQVDVSNIQIKALNEEKKSSEIDKSYDKILALINEIKTYRELVCMESFSTAYGNLAIKIFKKYLKELKEMQNDKKTDVQIKDEFKAYNLNTFRSSFVEYLQVVELTGANLIKFHAYNDNSFVILKKKFYTEIGDLNMDLFEILSTEVIKDINLRNIYSNANETHDVTHRLLFINVDRFEVPIEKSL